MTESRLWDFCSELLCDTAKRHRRTFSRLHPHRIPGRFGTVSPGGPTAADGATLTMRGSGFQNGLNVLTLGRKDGCGRGHEKVKVVAPGLSPVAHRVLMPNPGSEAVPVDAAFVAN